MLSAEMAEKLAERLGLDPKLRSEFISTVRRKKGRISKAGFRTSHGVLADPAYHQLTLDTFHVISDWYHFAILNLRDCDDFVAREDWIAKRLNIGIAEVRLALKRLERVGLIERKGADWNRTFANLTTTHEVPSAALRQGHRGILEKAIDALESVDIEFRTITNMTIAIDPRRMREAKTMVDRFRRRFAKTFEKDKSRSEVYTLAIQFFPLTQIRPGKKL